MIKIETKFDKLRQNTIAVYRRVLTPFFYVNLKTKTYKRSQWPVNFYGLIGVYTGWRCNGDVVTDRELITKLDAANKRVTGNVLRIIA